MPAPSKESLTATDCIAAARGLIVHGAHSAIARVFGALVDLQPMQWTGGGLLCAPWLEPGRAAEAIARCPLPLSPADPPPTVPDTPARLVAGWYRRTDLHATAPTGVRELVQVAGTGFGPHDHPTTEMCLASLPSLPSGRAIDVGCGSGLLSQAWVAMGREVALGIDADPGAIAQARRSMIAAGRHSCWDLRVGRIEELVPALTGDAIVLANLPPIAHAALMRNVTRPPRALVISGTSRVDAGPLVTHYRALGLRVVRMMHSGRYVCITLVRA